MNEQNKTYSYIGVGLVLLIVIIWAIYANTNKDNGINNNQQISQQTNSADNTLATSTPTATPTPAGTAIAKKLSYSDAIKAYPERFQFSNGCQGTPATIAVRKGTPVMLDNRNATAYGFKADTQTFKIAGYDYEVFYPEVLGNLVVDCNGKPSVTLNVEK